MITIKKLPPHEAHKIAAGEVVERPANIAKELIENSLDAGATQIFLHLQQAGKKLLRVVDNGHGMSQEDAQVCFEHHATSKITRVDDLDTIDTFGFRGEALSSIAAVSNVTLITKKKDTEQGIKLELTDGQVTHKNNVTCNTGTDICIENIFYNVPARKKFLKKDETERRHIHQLFNAFCLAYKNVHFKLFHDTKCVINCPPTDSVANRMAQLWHNNHQKLLTVQAEHANKSITVTGAVSDHQTARFDRNQIFFFVNNRWIKNYELSRALLKGYTNVLPGGKYPTAALFVTIDTTHVDVNIHPRKEEVQFLHPRMVETTITTGVKDALEHNLSSHIQQPVNIKPAQAFVQPAVQQSMQPRPSTFVPFNFDALPFEKKPIGTPAVVQQQTTPVQQRIEQPPEIPTVKQQSPYKLIGQYNKTYILTEHENGLFLVDQHAAHERILYENFAQNFKNLPKINLLFPALITLSPQDCKFVEQHMQLLQHNSIDVELFGENQLKISATPVHLKNVNLQKLIQEFIGWLHESNTTDTQELANAIHKKLHAQMACKAAVKAGDVLTSEQMQKLLDDLAQTDNRLTCPHGRPTGFLWSLTDIEKKFKRDYPSTFKSFQ